MHVCIAFYEYSTVEGSKTDCGLCKHFRREHTDNVDHDFSPPSTKPEIRCGSNTSKLARLGGLDRSECDGIATAQRTNEDRPMFIRPHLTISTRWVIK